MNKIISKYMGWGILIAIIVMISIATFTTSSTQQVIKEWVSSYSLIFMLLRWGIYLFVLLRWPYWMKRQSQNNGWDEVELARAISYRFRLGCWFLIIELFIGQNILGKFVHIILSH